MKVEHLSTKLQVKKLLVKQRNPNKSTYMHMCDITKILHNTCIYTI